MTQPTDSAEAGRSPWAKFSGDTLAGDGVRRWFAWESAVMAITARPVWRTGVVLDGWASTSVAFGTSIRESLGTTFSRTRTG